MFIDLFGSSVSVAKALLTIIAASMALILVIVLIKFVTRKKHPRTDEDTNRKDYGRISSWFGLYSFSRYEIENAINFSYHKISLGAGSAGCVYKGVLPSCCTEGWEQYLVYEYRNSALSWDMRVKILRDCAQALPFLHRYPDAYNILLTEKMEPKLSDFGLAKMLFTDVWGTIGYINPEYMSNAKLTCASDIYSFGIVILQVL
ncbi:hypothetical protein Sjap_000763 [Stephania japonica]|uniref:Protein kinase domain-containing protein n=1 Tax=Stephania japonica TaxID=461633 RepID=A0AAP0KIR0_9MAGN